MLKSINISSQSHSKRMTYSMIAFCCPVLLAGMIFFLSTPQGRAFNEDTFGRLYTLGALLMLGFYGGVGLILVVLGLTLGVIACIRRESPSWLPYVAVGVNVLAPFAIVRFLGSM